MSLTVSNVISKYRGMALELAAAIFQGASDDLSLPTGQVALWYNSTTDRWRALLETGAIKSLAFLDEVNTAAALAAVTTGNGAALVGIEDSAALITATTVEAALAEITKKANAALGVPICVPVILSKHSNSSVAARLTPGFAGKIRKISFSVTDPVTTGSKLATFTPAIAGVSVTGGALALTSANCTPVGAKVDGSAITALNSFTAAQEITIVASAVTAFIEGQGVIYLHLDPA